MKSTLFARLELDPDIAPFLEDLLQETLYVVLGSVIALTWMWATYVFLFIPRRFYPTLGIFLLILVITWVTYVLSRKRADLAAGVYLAGLMGAVFWITSVFRNSTVLYLYSLIVLIASVLTSPSVELLTALISLGLVWLGRQDLGTVWLREAGPPFIFIILTSLTAWLGARRLFVSLGWTLSVALQARENAEEARRRRAELRQVLKSLDEAYVRIERVNESLLLAQEAAERAYRFKSEFVANVSHELRTPLNLITGFTEMMATAPESYGGVPLPKEYRGDIMATYRSAKHLAALIDDVLDLSRIEAGRMPLVREKSDLRDIVQEAAEIVRGLVEARGLCLEVDAPADLPLLPIDRTRIRQVLLNLLTNASRFTEKGGISIRVRLDEDEVYVTVEDTGRGISEERLSKAFEVFSQLEDGQARSGSGLGLAVSKRFIEMHGGRMWIDSEIGRGTTVGFTLPVPVKEAERSLATVSTTSAPRVRDIRPLVLVLHDDLRVISLLNRYVQGYQFQLAESLEQARKLVWEIPPVAVVVDPAWSGLYPDLSGELGAPPYVPVITCPLPSMHRMGSLLGVTDYLPKPVTRDELEAALGRLSEPPRTVLVVDDNPHVVRLLGRMLKAINPSFRVLEAFGGQEGLAALRAERPDVVLLDLMMPEMNGYEVLAQIADDEELRKTRIFVVSVRSIEQEMAPISGDIRVACAAGLSLTQVLQILRAALASVTRVDGLVPSNETELPTAPPD